MSVRFKRSKSLGKLGRINLTKGGMGISIGPKGARIGVGPRGVYTSAGIPGTGIYGINYLNKKSSENSQSKLKEKQEQGTVRIPVPKELEPSALAGVVLVASIILFLLKHEIAILGLIVFFVLHFRSNKSEKALARKAFIRGRNALEKGDYESALTSLTSVLEYNDRIVSLYPIVAGLYKNKGLFSQAVQYYSKYVEAVPDDYLAQIDYAMVLTEIGESEKALTILQSLPEELKGDVEVLSLLGAVFIKAGKPDLAIIALEKGPTQKRKMDEQMMGFRYVLGKAYKEVGENKKAINQLQKVYAEDINYMDVAEEIERLKR